MVAATMRPLAGARKLVPMNEQRRVIVETDPAARPIAGSVACNGAPSRPFVGWLELLTVLDAALTPSPSVKEDR